MIDLAKFKALTHNLSVLYVEDEVELRRVFEQYLRKFFKKITSCSNGYEGLKEYKKNEYDIVITDINMPIMDGLNMSKEIKQLNPNQHILIISAYKDIDNYIESIRLGIDGYVLKPIEYDQVNDLLFKISSQIIAQIENEEYKTNLENLVEMKTREIREQFITDSLTGLPNRILLDEKIQSPDKLQTILLLNMDNFSIFNHNYGFAIGDQILKATKDILLDFQSGDFILYRLQRDEFVFFCEKPNLVKAKQIANDIQKYFDENQVLIDDIEFDISFTFAIDFGKNKDLLRTVSLTLQQARQVGKNQIAIYEQNSEFETVQKNNLLWKKRIKEHLIRKEFYPFFQPIQNMRTGEIIKYEALARIITKEGEIISPFVFLQPLIYSGYISQFTKMIIEKGMQTIQNTNIRMSFNITDHDLYENYLIHFLLEKTAQYNLQPSQIILEILESISIKEDASSLTQIYRLKELGYKIAIDDFGTENSNFSRLLALKVDYIKIDGSFVKNLLEDKNSLEIIKSIVSFAHNINCKVIAEYVYNESVYEKLKELDVDFAQGYYIAEPSQKIIEKS